MTPEGLKEKNNPSVLWVTKTLQWVWLNFDLDRVCLNPHYRHPWDASATGGQCDPSAECLLFYRLTTAFWGWIWRTNQKALATMQAGKLPALQAEQLSGLQLIIDDFKTYIYQRYPQHEIVASEQDQNPQPLPTYPPHVLYMLGVKTLVDTPNGKVWVLKGICGEPDGFSQPIEPAGDHNTPSRKQAVKKRPGGIATKGSIFDQS